MAIHLAEIIDRIGITVPLASASRLMQCNDQLWKAIKQWKGMPKQLEGGWRGTFKFGLDASVGVTVAKRYGYRYLQYDFKPTELDAFDFDTFTQLTSSFPDATYAEALVNGRVSYLEIAIDYPFKNTWDLLTHMRGAHTSTRYFPAHVSAPTSYTGAPKSTSRSAAYTKLKPFVLGKQVLNAPHVRIERRLRNLGMPPVDLGSLPNQFANLEVFSFATAHKLAAPSKEWQPFLQSAETMGVSSALAKYPSTRKALLASLRQCRVPWWAPDRHMTGWGETVANQLRLSLAVCPSAS